MRCVEKMEIYVSGNPGGVGCSKYVFNQQNELRYEKCNAIHTIGGNILFLTPAAPGEFQIVIFNFQEKGASEMKKTTWWKPGGFRYRAYVFTQRNELRRAKKM